MEIKREIVMSFLNWAYKEFKSIIQRFAESIRKMWGSVKEILSKVEEIYDTPKHPACMRQKPKRRNLYSQVLINKPMRIRARTTC